MRQIRGESIHGGGILRLLFLGDVVGKPGRRAVKALLPSWRKSDPFDAVIVNGENAAGGFGITAETAAELFAAGVDFITLGNHAFSHREAAAFLEREPRVIRPANYPEGTPGRGSGVFPCGRWRLGLLNLEGRVFMNPLDDPFRLARTEIERLRRETPYILVDFHAEATSEKIAMGWHLDGLASAVIGTHTHVQTADERILPHGTAYITDVGMCGPTDGILGVERGLILRRFLSQLPVRFEVAGGPVAINALALELGPDGRAIAIQRLARQMDDEQAR